MYFEIDINQKDENYVFIDIQEDVQKECKNIIT